MPLKYPQSSEDPIFDIEMVAAATECTGLIPSAVLDDEEATAYAELYAIHEQKPNRD